MAFPAASSFFIGMQWLWDYQEISPFYLGDAIFTVFRDTRIFLELFQFCNGLFRNYAGHFWCLSVALPCYVLWQVPRCKSHRRNKFKKHPVKQIKVIQICHDFKCAVNVVTLFVKIGQKDDVSERLKLVQECISTFGTMQDNLHRFVTSMSSLDAVLNAGSDDYGSTARAKEVFATCHREVENWALVFSRLRAILDVFA